MTLNPPRLRLSPPGRLRWPRRTARLRFTAAYAGLFLASGAALIAVTYILFLQATQYTKPHLPNIPRAPAAVQPLHLPQLPGALSQLTQDQYQLAQDQQQLTQLGLGFGRGPLAYSVPQLTQDQQHLAQDQKQLAAAVDQLAQAEHQVAQAGSVQAAQRATDSHELLINSAIALAIVALLALLASWLVAGRMLRPIRTITATARRISATNLQERLGLHHADEEFRRLADTLDALFARLAAAFEAQRHFVANASHELRTPLTAERNLLQVALDDPHTSNRSWRDTARELLASNDEQKHLIEALLALASSESGLDHQERTDLATICQTVLARAHPDFDNLGLSVENDTRPAKLYGDPRLVERLVANLVDNAATHNIYGGHVQISTDTTGGKAVLSVSNTGPVIPPEEIDRLFQPFQRLDPRRTHKNGHGLGLAIVKAIAATHCATITAHPRPEGGLSVTVIFPPPGHPSTSPEWMSRPRRIAAGHP
jgi:signal transduction histidine kinase